MNKTRTPCRHPRESGDPMVFMSCKVKMDSRFRGNDEQGGIE